MRKKYYVLIGIAALISIPLLLVVSLGGADEKFKHKVIKTVVKLSGADISPNPAMRASFDPERDEKAKEELGYIVGAQAYLYGLPGLRLEDFRYGTRQLIKLSSKLDLGNDVGEDGLTYNELTYLKKLPNANMRFGASPNNDTLYGGIFYKLDEEPLVFMVPGIKGRYFDLQITDAFFSNDGYIVPEGDGRPCQFLIMGPEWTGETPEGLTPVRVSTNEGYLAVRILVDGPEEYPLVNKIQSEFDARPLSQYLNPQGPRERDPIEEPDDSGELAAYRRIAQIARRNPSVKERDRAAWDSFQYIGLYPDKPFDPDKIDPAVRRGMKRAIDAVHDIVAWKVKYRGYKAQSNWRVDLLGGAYGQNYLRRTESVIQGLFLHDPAQALYFLTYHDREGNLLNGGRNYTLRFRADQLPPVKEFWSITLYDETYNYVENPIERFAIGDRTKGLKFDPDGSLTLYLQAEEPKNGASNWLPTPAGKNFRLTFRMYKPGDVMRNPETLERYLPPVIAQ